MRDTPPELDVAAALTPTEPLVPGWQHSIALLGGIALWMLHLVALMGLNGIACANGALGSLYAVTAVTAVATAGCGWLGWRIQAHRGDDPHVSATSFLGWVAVAMNGASLLLILFESIPLLFVNPCA